MTREDLKKHWEVIQAFKDGFEIEFNYKDVSDSWSTASGNVGFHFDRYEYRIKPEPKVIPFDFTDAEFLIGKAVINKGGSIVNLVTEVGPVGINGGFSFVYLSENFTFLDGSPCGKVVENGAV